ncbi:MAG: excinuclease ABC subunit UvrC [bacterium]|nr:excinuclease ABC subunit UvrC [bacterium]
MFDIEEELKKLPRKPGVYIMHDEDDAIIYVGKAIILRNRVRSYFRESTNKTAKIQKMVSLIKRFEYIVTDSELEALVLENNLIKEYQPKYNTMLKDDKTYPYIKVTTGEEYPRVLITREQKKDNAKYYGPYSAAGAVKDTVELLRRLYKLRTCTRNFSAGTDLGKPCLYYHINQCSAPCIGAVSKEDYRAAIDQAVDFLGGNYKPILQELEGKMEQASEEMNYEKAKEYRDLLYSVKGVAQKQKITNHTGDDRDIIALATNESAGVIQIFFVRGGKLIGREHFYMTNIDENDRGKIIQGFIQQFYAGTPFIPRELMIQETVEDTELIEQWLSELRGKKVRIVVPQKGQKEKLVELAAQNAAIILKQDEDKLKREVSKTSGALQEIADLLDISGVHRIEAFDISNISGYESVGSMVVYEGGKPKRSDYRKFKIKSVQGPDDYASMEEVLGRRFAHGLQELEEIKGTISKSTSFSVESEVAEAAHYGKFTKFPDLIMMDGGKGQVNVATRVLAELGLDIPVCGMVKDDNHRTRGLYFHDVELPIDRGSEGFKLITRVQDEAHRFAIEYHRSLRTKGQVHSILDDIQGVGEKRRRALMKHFESIDDLKEASVDDIMKVPSLNRRAAEQIHAFFHEKAVK